MADVKGVVLSDVQKAIVLQALDMRIQMLVRAMKASSAGPAWVEALKADLTAVHLVRDALR